MTIHTLSHFKCIRLVPVRVSHIPFKLHLITTVRSSLPCINIGVRIELMFLLLLFVVKKVYESLTEPSFHISSLLRSLVKNMVHVE